jgi:putative heme-binding domain-containing protein
MLLIQRKWFTGWLLGGAVALLTFGTVQGFPEPEGQDVRERQRAYARRGTGSPEAGRKLFFDAALSCSACHTVGGTGGHAGPDLSRLAERADRDEIISSVLEPSKRIAPGWQRVIVATTAGTVLRGRLLSQSATHIEIRVGSRPPQRLARDEIEELTLSDESDMPEGLTDHLGPAQFADLVAYLASLEQHP